MADRYDDDAYRRRRDRGEEEGSSRRFRGEDSQRHGEPRGRSQGANRPDRGQDWDRTRQWRQGYGQENERGGYGRSNWNREPRDFDRYGPGRGANRDFDYSESYGRSYNRGSYYGNDRDRDMNRDWDQEARGRGYNRDYDRGRPSAARIYDTDWYDWNFERGFEEDDYNRDPNQFYGYGQNYDWEARYNNANQNRGYNRRPGRRQQYGTAGMGSDFEGSTGQYRSAGMRSDYGGYGYDSQDYGEGGLDYRRGDIGYESEGAFYQDLDEPVNFTYYEVWMIPGEFTGMGPKNYRRSDERIKEEVCERLTRHGRIDASGVEIDVRDGEVTLKGSVQNREMKRMAEDTTESISGVRQVNNEIRVQRGESWSRAEQDSGRDSWLARESSSRRDSESWREQSVNQDQQRSRRPGSQQIPGTGAGAASAAMETTAGESVGAAGMDDKRSQLHEDMEVIGSNGKVVGRVKEIRASDFLVDRDMARDIYVPFDKVRSIGAQVMLDVQDDEVDNQGWDNPAIL